jgi:positive regulator of sigma E activity
MIVQGQVTKVLPKAIEVRLQGVTDCASCKGCAGCSEKESPLIIIATEQSYKKGTILSLETDSKYFYRSFFLVFIFPIMILVGILAVGEKLHWVQNFALTLGIIGWLGSYSLAYAYDKKLQAKALYRILK